VSYFTRTVLTFARRLRKCSSIVHVFFHSVTIRHVINQIAVSLRSCHVISSHMMEHLISSLHIMSLHIIKCPIISHRTTIISHHTISLHHITPHHITLYHTVCHCSPLFLSQWLQQYRLTLSSN
jgi:hypothetical protein